MTGRRAAQRQETETRIRQAALAVFARMGFAAATMDCIATEAGVTKPTLYSYFDSKDALFAAVLLAPREDMLLPIAAGQSDAHVTQMHGFAWQYARVVLRDDYLSLARLVIGEAQRHPDSARPIKGTGQIWCWLGRPISWRGTERWAICGSMTRNSRRRIFGADPVRSPQPRATTARRSAKTDRGRALYRKWIARVPAGLFLGAGQRPWPFVCHPSRVARNRVTKNRGSPAP